MKPQRRPAGLLLIRAWPPPDLISERESLGSSSKSAETSWSSPIVSSQLPVPVQSPSQPEKWKCFAGVWVIVTALPSLSRAEACSHAYRQTIPPEALILPGPEPEALARVRAWAVMKTAPTCLALDIATVHWRPFTPPASQCFQAMNREPALGEAVRVTFVPSGYSSKQKGLQEIRPLSEVTVPGPSTETVRGMPASSGSASKLAATPSSPLPIVTTQVLAVDSSHCGVPQPLKRLPAFGVSVNVTLAPSS